MQKGLRPTDRFLFVLALTVLVIGFALTACERSATEDIGWVADRIATAYSEKPVELPHPSPRLMAYEKPIVEVTDPELTAQLQAESYGKFREEKINGLLEAFFPVEEPVEISSTPWKDGIRNQERPELFNVLCDGLNRFQSMTWAFREMDAAGGIYNISWEELRIPVEAAQLIYHDTGLTTARVMIQMILEVPRHVRKHIEPCYRGEGSWNFSNEKDEFDRLVEILDAANLTEEEIGLNKEDLRTLLILELNDHVQELENAVQEGYVGQDEALDCLTFIADQAAEEWRIPTLLLGMSPQNVKATRERREVTPRACSEEVNITLMR